jgi:hypothetical protein
MRTQTILLTLAAAILCVVTSSPVFPVITMTVEDSKVLDMVLEAQEVDKTNNYWADTVTNAITIDAGRRSDWQNLIVAVDSSLTGGPRLDEEIVNAVVKFNTPKYEDCQVDSVRHDEFYMMDTFVDVCVWCSFSEVLSARISPTQGSARQTRRLQISDCGNQIV